MKRKELFYLFLGILGIALVVSAIVLEGRVPDAVDGTLIGVGAGLLGLGFSLWRFCRFAKKDPVKWKQYEVESRDERNVLIRLRAKAAAGEALQWAVLAAAWAAMILDAPLWVVLAAVGIFLCKTVLEVFLMARYEKKM